MAADPEPSGDRRGGPQLDLTLSQSEEVVVVSIRGDVDHYTCERLRCALEAVVATGATSVMLNCAEMTFLDSGGIGVIAELIAALQPRGGVVTICNASQITRRLLAITGLDGLAIVS